MGNVSTGCTVSILIGNVSDGVENTIWSIVRVRSFNHLDLVLSTGIRVLDVPGSSGSQTVGGFVVVTEAAKSVVLSVAADDLGKSFLWTGRSNANEGSEEDLKSKIYSVKSYRNESKSYYFLAFQLLQKSALQCNKYDP